MPSDPFFTSCSVCRIRTRTADGFIPTTVERTSYRKVNRAPRRSRIDLFQVGIKSHHEIIKENSLPLHALTRALVASMDRLPCLVSDFQKIYTANVQFVQYDAPVYNTKRRRHGYRDIFWEEGVRVQGRISGEITDLEFEKHKNVKKCILRTLFILPAIVILQKKQRDK